MTIHTINLWVCDIQTPACERTSDVNDFMNNLPGWVHLLMLVGIPTAFFALMGAGD